MSILQDRWQYVYELFSHLPKPNPEFHRRQATDLEFESAETTLGFPIPLSLKTWLRFCNGALLGPGGYYGVFCDDYDLVYKMQAMPVLIDRRWFPIAGDGCGNIYVLTSACQHPDLEPVLFMDLQSDCDWKTSFFVSSKLDLFLTLIFLTELRHIRWPFDKVRTLEIDPDLVKLPLERLPWKAG